MVMPLPPPLASSDADVTPRVDESPMLCTTEAMTVVQRGPTDAGDIPGSGAVRRHRRLPGRVGELMVGSSPSVGRHRKQVPIVFAPEEHKDRIVANGTEPTLDASVIVPSFEGAHRLPILLEALSRQDFDGSWEALVVIDGIADDSEAVVDAWSEHVPVRTIVLATNQGRSAALNAGFDAAAGRVLVRCDDDLEPAPDYVSAHTKMHAGPSPRGVVGLYRNVFPDTPYATAYGTAADLKFKSDAYAAPQTARWKYWAGNCSVTRDTYDAVGPYDTTFRGYGWEDVDWGYRLAQTGADIILDRDLETPHHVAATTTEIRVVRAHRSGAARRRFEAKHHTSGHPGPAVVPPSGLAQKAWRGGVAAVSLLGSEARMAALARLTDRSLPRLPHRLAEKAVALDVEAAAAAGYRAGGTDLGAFSSQKHAELSAERR